jgi:hypothetical protein
MALVPAALRQTSQILGPPLFPDGMVWSGAWQLRCLVNEGYLRRSVRMRIWLTCPQ